MNKETGEVLIYKEKIDKNGYKSYESYDGKTVVRRHIKEEWNEIFRDNRLSEEGKELYKRRKEHVERSFADSKQNHGYRYAMYKGIKKNQHYTWLICAAQNMKNISIKRDNILNNLSIYSTLLSSITKFYKNFKKITLKIFA